MERNWELCLLCQSTSSEPLVNPSNNTRLKRYPEELDSTLRNLLENIKMLNDIDELPKGVTVDDLFERVSDTSVADTVQQLKSNHVVWHKGCKNTVDNQKVKRAQLRRTNADVIPSPVKTRRISNEYLCQQIDMSQPDAELPGGGPLCLLCDKSGGKTLRKAATFGLDAKIRRCAAITADKALIRKLSSGDMIAIDAVYHLSCLVKLYRQAASIECAENDENDQSRFLKAQAFADLVDYIESQRGTGSVFKTAEIVSLYSSRLLSLGVNEYVHTTRLRQKVIAAVPDLVEVKCPSNRTELAFDDDISQALQELADSCDTEAMALVKAAKILRQHMLSMKYNFTGSFSPESEVKSVPSVLLSFQEMLLNGPGIMKPKCPQTPAPAKTSAAALSISQLIMYNSVKQRSSNLGTTSRHIRHRENPLVIYIATKIYVNTRMESLVESMHERGLCISYSRLRTISTDLANSLLRLYQMNDTVFPVQALRGVFTTSEYDNIDHNPRAMTCRTSFHGSCQSIIQFPTPDNPGSKVGPESIFDPEVMGKTGIDVLPQSYTAMEEVSLPKDDVIYVPDLEVNSWLKSVAPPLKRTIQDGYQWLEQARELYLKDQLVNGDWISWAAYHASQTTVIPPVTPSHMLPVFRESATSPMMVYHAMNIAKAVTNHLNPGQTPVIVADQPLYTIMKKLQWKYPESHGEDRCVIMLGAMHVEKMFWEMNGTWFDGSGWTTALANSRVVSSGVAESFIGVSHITRTRYVHQVSGLTLYILLHQAYDAYLNSKQLALDPEEQHLSFEAWVNHQKQKEPQFLYWHRGMELELTTLQFVKSIRTADFELYLETIEQLSPWVFALDRTHYKRNLTVHTRDMHVLEELHPAIYNEFAQGHFVGQKSRRAFSSIALDQMHEQLIGELKGNGGIIGLTENPAELRRHLIVGPELSRLVQEFEQQATSTDVGHHEQYAKFQSTFKTDVQALVEAFCDLGNPFLEDSGQLIELDGYAIMPLKVVDAVKSVITIGTEQYEDFFDKRIIPPREKKLRWNAPIQKNKLPLLDPSPKSLGGSKSEVSSLKEERSKVIQLMLAANSGRVINKEVFSHESTSTPPSLTRKGHMFHGTKADILPLLEAEGPPGPSTRPSADAAVLDGPAIVQLIKPGSSVTIGDYIHANVIHYLTSWLENLSRLDIIWDIYKPNSLKRSTRESRGTGLRRRVTLQTKVPANFAEFLRVDANKTELFTLIAQEIEKLELQPGKQLISTRDTFAVSAPPSDVLTSLAPCFHEEADTRMFVHVADQTLKGFKRVVIRTTDSDVVVIGVSVVQHLKDLDELWIAFGSGKNFRYIPGHQIAQQLGSARSAALPAFHSFTGCDTVSSLYGKGKKTAWNVWRENPDVTSALKYLAGAPRDITESVFSSIQEFVVKMYDLEGHDVDAARLDGFYYKGRDFDHLPPSSDALYQHVLRASYQGGHIWGNALNPCPALPDPSRWGWEIVSEYWQPIWISKPVISTALKQLVSCHCKKECKPPCKCCVAGVKCTTLCTCRGHCYGKARATEV